MSELELEHKIVENKQRITEINTILKQTKYGTVEEAQELRSQAQALKDEVPILQKKIHEIQARKKSKAREDAKRRLNAIAGESKSIQSKILKIQINLLKKVTQLRALRQEVMHITYEFIELRSLQPPFHFADYQALRDFILIEPFVAKELWEKNKKEWYEARERYYHPKEGKK